MEISREKDLLYAQLMENLRALDFQREYPADGTFTPKRVKGRIYWYFQEPSSRGRRQKYVGPDSEALQALIEEHGNTKGELLKCRQLVRVNKPRPEGRGL